MLRVLELVRAVSSEGSSAHTMVQGFLTKEEMDMEGEGSSRSRVESGVRSHTC